MTRNGKIFILGLDGATWDLLNPLIDEGVMPNLKRVTQSGASGVLRSTIPPYTAPAWVSCVTGVGPGRHGVFGFTLKENGVPGSQFVDSTRVMVPKLWNYINASGRRVGLVNIPVTYPAEAVDGFMVPCFLTPLGKEDYTYPPSVYRDFLLPMNYVINIRMAALQDFAEDVFLRLIDDIKDMMMKRHKVTKTLAKAYHPDFMMVVFTSMDKMQHKFWKYLDPRSPMYDAATAKKARPHLHSVYRMMDDIIGEVAGGLDDDTTLYMVSDHGFGPKDRIFYINKWLYMNGYLKVKKMSIIRQRLTSGKQEKDYSNRNIDILNHPIYRSIDFQNSSFVGSDPYEQGIYYVGRGGEQEKKDLIDEVKGKLKELKDPETGAGLFEDVCRKDELYPGSCTDMAPDLVLKLNDYRYGLVRGFPLKAKWFTTVRNPAGCHHPDGIFVAYGKDIVAKRGLDLSIVDVAPTALHTMGLPVHNEMDGRVITEIFSSGFNESHGIRYTDARPAGRQEMQQPEYTLQEQEEITERLRDLGYLD